MKRITPILGLTAALACACAAVAQDRPYTPSLTCSAIKTIVARDGHVVLASSENAYEMVHVDSMSCGSDETGAPAFEPSSDVPSCLAGWRCKQRSSGGEK